MLAVALTQQLNLKSQCADPKDVVDEMLGSLSSSQQQALMANYISLAFNLSNTSLYNLDQFVFDEISNLYSNPDLCNEDVICLVDEPIAKERMCAESIAAETLEDINVEAWYFKFLNLSYVFQYRGVDISGKVICETYNVGFNDLCAEVYRNPTDPGSSGAAAVDFSKAFDNAICETVNWLDISPWDDILIWSAGPGAEETSDALMFALITSRFYAFLELNLEVNFGGNPTLTSGPCDGVQGRHAVFSSDCN